MTCTRGGAGRCRGGAGRCRGGAGRGRGGARTLAFHASVSAGPATRFWFHSTATHSGCCDREAGRQTGSQTGRCLPGEETRARGLGRGLGEGRRRGAAARRAACRANWRISLACSPCCEEKRIWSSSMTYLRAQARARICVAVPASALPSDARAARCTARCGARLAVGRGVRPGSSRLRVHARGVEQ